MNKLVFGLVLALGFTTLFAQESVSPYTGEESREIKSLSEGDIGAYLSGQGMGFAKVAELNHYPGPKHVLELADKLKLSEKQRQQTQKIFDEMHSEAVKIGKEIVERERVLDTAFATSNLDEMALTEMLSEIGALQGRLRFVHLKAHLVMKQLLSAHQIAKYDSFRGYAGEHRHDGNHH